MGEKLGVSAEEFAEQMNGLIIPDTADDSSYSIHRS